MMPAYHKPVSRLIKLNRLSVAPSDAIQQNGCAGVSIEY